MNRWAVILFLAIIIAALLSQYASPLPDGLERVAEDLGFLEKGESPVLKFSPMPDYTITTINNEKISTAIAGITGTLITLAFAWGCIKLIAKG
ncbi:PDGLE domain-containing protein [Thermovorax subterraneus]|nr:PDGLE domain-containing protein [Thermovorax subterraneus]